MPEIASLEHMKDGLVTPQGEEEVLSNFSYIEAFDVNELSLISNKSAYTGRISKFSPKSFAAYPKTWYQTIELRHKVS